VRCARCGGTWTAAADDEERLADTQDPRLAIPDAHTPQLAAPPDHQYEEHEAVPAPVTAMARLAALAPPQPRSTGLAAGWIVTGVVLTVAVAATITWRQQVVRVWPASSRLLGSVLQVTSASVPHAGTSAAQSHAAKE
jgi:hypothetical protein